MHVINFFSAKLLHKDYQYHKLLKTFFKSSTADTMNWFQKFKVGSKSPLQQARSEPEIHGDLVYKLKKNVRGLIFLISSEQLSYVTNVI